jgi:hypothetical protein
MVSDLNALYLQLAGRRNAKSRGEVAVRDLRRPNRRLQIVVCLCSRAAGLEHIGQRRQPEIQARLRRLLHGLRVLEVGFRRILLPFGVQHPVVRCHDLEDDLAVRVVEKEVGGQQIVPADGNLLHRRPKSKMV